MTYNTIKRIILNGNKNNAVTHEKLDVFLLNNRITEEEYNDLIAMLEG